MIEVHTYVKIGKGTKAPPHRVRLQPNEMQCLIAIDADPAPLKWRLNATAIDASDLPFALHDGDLLFPLMTGETRRATFRVKRDSDDDKA